MKLPALWIAAEGSFAVTDKPLTSCTYAAYRNGFFHGLRYLDSAGDSWLVREVIFQRQPNILDRFLNRKLEVELRMEGPEQVSLSDIAELLCSCVDRDPDDLYNQFIDHQELKSLFRSAQSVAELLHLARTLGSDLEDEEAV